jgi:hypothetical protein
MWTSASTGSPDLTMCVTRCTDEAPLAAAWAFLSTCAAVRPSSDSDEPASVAVPQPGSSMSEEMASSAKRPDMDHSPVRSGGAAGRVATGSPPRAPVA